VFMKACHWSVSRWIHSTLMHIHKHAPTPSYFSKIHFNIILLCVLDFLVISCSQVFPPKPYMHSCPLHGICPAHLSRIIFGEDSKFYSSSLFSFLQPPSILSILGPDVLLSILFSCTLSLYFSLNMRELLSHQKLQE
jgi:hypothetical protein